MTGPSFAWYITQLGRASDQHRSLTRAVVDCGSGIGSGHGTTAGTDTTAGIGSLLIGKQTDVMTAGGPLCIGKTNCDAESWMVWAHALAARGLGIPGACSSSSSTATARA
jgi:hypothetical protein